MGEDQAGLVLLVINAHCASHGLTERVEKHGSGDKVAYMRRSSLQESQCCDPCHDNMGLGGSQAMTWRQDGRDSELYEPRRRTDLVKQPQRGSLKVPRHG